MFQIPFPMKRCGLTQRVAFALTLARFFPFLADFVRRKQLTYKRCANQSDLRESPSPARVRDKFADEKWRQCSRRGEDVRSSVSTVRLVVRLPIWLRAFGCCIET